MEVRIVPALKDNYTYVIVLKEGCICIDPSESKPVIDHLQGNLLAILNTHHHADHIGGNEELKVRFQCPLIAPADERIPNVDVIAREGEPIVIHELTFDVISVPGHTRSDIAYYSKEHSALFCGDCLFAGGCGRIFEGTPAQMFESLQKLARLPSETKVFCGHEYTLRNLEFALHLDAENTALQKRYAHNRALINQGAPTIPSTIGIELATNPFLRCADIATFAKLRQAKDQY